MYCNCGNGDDGPTAQNAKDFRSLHDSNDLLRWLEAQSGPRILGFEHLILQVADIEAERKPVDARTLEYIHRSKTAALIRASVTAGALCAGAPPDDVARLRRFGETIGWAFQVTDDILDVEESSAALGKTAGKDLAQQKATYPAMYGLERSHEIARELATKAISELSPYVERAARLREIAEYLVLRRT